ncbi:hypothetical protein [Hymenobacter tenuis]
MNNFETLQRLSLIASNQAPAPQECPECLGMNTDCSECYGVGRIEYTYDGDADKDIAWLVAELSRRIPVGMPQTLEQLFLAYGQALLEKALRAREKYGFPVDGWKDPEWKDELVNGLLSHVHKGDPRDVGVYSAFAWWHGWSITPPLQKYDAYQLLQEAYDRGWKASGEGYNAEVYYDHATDENWLARRQSEVAKIIAEAISKGSLQAETASQEPEVPYGQANAFGQNDAAADNGFAS